MKHTIRTIIGTLSISALAYNAPAQVIGGPPNDTAPERVTKPPQRILDLADSKPVLAGAATASDLIGMRVENPQGDKLGEVQEIAVDLESGRMIQMILTTGGFLGIGAEKSAVPPASLVLDGERQFLQLDAGKEKLEAAPPFDNSKWSEAFTHERLAASYEHFGESSSLDFVDGADQPESRFTIPESRLEGVQHASKIVGMKVTNLQDEVLGDISEIMFDSAAGRILALVVDSGQYIGIEGGLSAIPATEFRFSTDRESLVIDTSKEALAAAPHFKSDRWPDFTNADTVESIFVAYSVEAYFRPGNGVEPRGNTQGRPDAKDKATQGDSPRDMAITSAISREIRELENISPNARKVSVVTRDGRITLSGAVDTAAEKLAIGEIATRNNQGTEVENLLEVNGTDTEIKTERELNNKIGTDTETRNETESDTDTESDTEAGTETE
jgi:sporulation protein YlmC with PRC-barrel domain/osmotically-inducible protein OsmY